MENERIEALKWLTDAKQATYADFAALVGQFEIDDLCDNGLIEDISLDNARTAVYRITRYGLAIQRIAELEAERDILKYENGNLDIRIKELDIRLNNAIDREEEEHYRWLKAVTDGKKIVQERDNLQAANHQLLTQTASMIVQVDEVQTLDERKKEIVETLKRTAIEAAERNVILEDIIVEMCEYMKTMQGRGFFPVVTENLKKADEIYQRRQASE
jgi:hypothetical protein